MEKIKNIGNYIEDADKATRYQDWSGVVGMVIVAIVLLIIVTG